MSDDILLYGSDNRPFKSVEQAWNILKARYKAVIAKTKKEAGKQPITIAPEEDRLRYLRYCISVLTEVDSDLLNLMPENIRVGYSRRELANMFRWFLNRKINGASDEKISKETGVPLNIIENVNIYAQEAVYRAIAKARKDGIPLVGGCS